MNSSVVSKLKQELEQKKRELAIQSSLEKVRTVAMAMKKPEDMLNVCRVISKELESLGIKEIRNIQTAIVNEEKAVYQNYEYLRIEKKEVVSAISYKLHKDTHAFIRKVQKGPEGFFTKTFKGAEIRNWMKFQAKSGHYVDPYLKKTDSLHYYFYSIGPGALGISTYAPLNKEAIVLFKRFRNVFKLSYQRFTDIQKAEANAREAEIQLSLERVRARALAMHKSEELTETSSVLFHELNRLGIYPRRSGFGIYDKQVDEIRVWLTTKSDGVIETAVLGSIPVDAHPTVKANYNAWKKKKSHMFQELTGTAVRDYYRKIGSYMSIAPQKKYPPRLIFNVYFFSDGSLNIIADEPLSDEQNAILDRFASVFDLTYRRFLDLQKAEAQTRQAQIELAVERVRAKALAMHKSEELHGVVTALKKELIGLDIPNVIAATMYLEQDDGSIRMVDLTTGGAEDPEDHLKLDKVFRLESTDPKLWVRRMFKNTKKYFVEETDEDDFKRVVRWLDSVDPVEARKAKKILREKKINKVWLPTIKLEKGRLNIDLLQPPTSEVEQIMLKLGAGFDLAYRRFLDLQKAEEQTRESQIEASLERVRAKAMSMHSSEELASTIKTFYHEIESLTVTPIRCGVAMTDKDTKIAELSTMNTTESGESFVVMGQIKMEGHPILDEVFQHWLKQKEYHATLRGNEIKEYYKILRPQIEFPDYPHDEVQYGYYFMFKEGDVYAWTENPLTEEQLKIYRRFTTVLSLTFKRYKDLKYAESQAREANIEVALERVRAKALAMQQPEELSDVAQVLRNEMGALGIEELETASIYIHEKDSGTAECWFALKDPNNAGKKMVADQFIVKLDDTWVGREMKKFYFSEEKQTSIVMKGERRKEWIEYCYNHSPAFSGYYGDSIPDRTYHLYKFSHGYIGAAAPGDISTESWRLLNRAASVFSLAYSRFKDLTQARNDLQRLKEEKQRAEAALAELKSTQTQLIQSEKMASLGELTAGIAHEIQNPLNFVNNFSELSNELITEMLEQLEKGNKENAIDLVEDIKQNLEKINQHGKRADSIVKSMLQHSRSSTGQKEPTDINALVDEYLRLAFHGFRAKDQSFNSKFETHLDESLEKIKIVPQEIGRVILNLINNAFYAVTEKRKADIPGYEPMVIVSTHKNNGMIEIRVRDNGNGMPSHVTEKIFQPFFTTKPTGQGTGLGLSLSYDIITKGHGGELTVKTNEGVGSEFVVQLPT